MNKGKENYQNIPLPDGLSDAVQKGLKKGKRHMEKKMDCRYRYTCRSLRSGLRRSQGSSRFPAHPAGEVMPPLSRVWRPSDGQTPEAAAFTATETAAGDSTETDPSAASPEDSTAAVENTASSSIRVYGTVTQIENGQILLENDEEGAAYPQVLLNLTEDHPDSLRRGLQSENAFRHRGGRYPVRRHQPGHDQEPSAHGKRLYRFL